MTESKSKFSVEYASSGIRRTYTVFSLVTSLMLSIGASAPAGADDVIGPIFPNLSSIATTDGETGNDAVDWLFDDFSEDLQISDATAYFADAEGNIDAFDNFGEIYVSADGFLSSYEVNFSDGECDFSGNGSPITYSEASQLSYELPNAFTVTCDADPIYVLDQITLDIRGTLTIQGSWASWSVAAQASDDIESLQVAIGGELGSDESTFFTFSMLGNNSWISSDFYDEDTPIIGYRSNPEADVEFGYGERIVNEDGVGMGLSTAPAGNSGYELGDAETADIVYAWTRGESIAAGQDWQQVHYLEVALLAWDNTEENVADVWHCAHYTVMQDALSDSLFGSYLDPVAADDDRCAEDFTFTTLSDQNACIGGEGVEGTFGTSEPALIDGVFQISTEAELLWIAAEADPIELNQNYVLTADLDLKNCTLWTAIGHPTEGADSAFEGSFDGGGHSIRGMSSGLLSDAGMFSTLAGDASVSNLTLISPRFYGDGVQNVGFIAGNIVENATISDVSIIDAYMNVTGEMNDSYRIGGVVGRAYSGELSNVTFEGIIDAGISDNYEIGGLVGSAPADSTLSILDSSFFGFVSGDSSVGGILGYSEGFSQGSTNTSGVTIRSSYSSGTILGEYYKGGLVGDLSDGEIDLSWSSTFIMSNEDTGGGLVGDMSGDSSISQSYFQGSIFGDEDTLGGLVGDMYGGSISESFATGLMYGDEDADWGGLVGHYEGNSITDSFSTIDIYSYYGDSVGGLIGHAVDNVDPLNLGTSFYAGRIIDLDSSSSVDAVVGYLEADILVAEYLFWNSDFTDGAGDPGTGLTSEEMLLCSSFSGFDFASVWSFAADGTSTHPELRWTVEDPEYWDNGCTNAVYSSNARAYEGPRVIKVSSPTVPQGTDLVLSGAQMDLVTKVMAGSENLEIKQQTATSATVHVPADAKLGLADIALTAVNGTVLFRRAIEVVPGTEALAATSKVNVGSFNGKIVVYAKGLAGSTLSWKIAGKWVTVEVTKDYQFFDRLTIAVGLPVNVDIYVDSTKRLSKTVLTR